jgi:CDP-diacylglycerol--glycerol-3-phosphate 3-phosphatidyltransferase
LVVSRRSGCNKPVPCFNPSIDSKTGFSKPLTSQSGKAYDANMNLPNFLTLSRIALAPVFFVLLFLPAWTGASFLITWLIAWVVFLYIEVSDIFDGIIARKRGLVTELGKLLDPFSDVVSRMTYFLAFSALGVMPAWMFLVLLYRELGITFLRSVLFNRGIALAARGGGKLKAVLYAISGGAGLLVIGARGIGFTAEYQHYIEVVAIVCYGLSILASLGSFLDYLRVAAKILRDTAKKPADETEIG